MAPRKKTSRQSAVVETRKDSAELIALVQESKNAPPAQRVHRIEEGIEELHARVGPVKATKACAQALLFFNRRAV